MCAKCNHKKRQVKQNMYMFFASVLLGQTTHCNSSDRRPPKNNKTGRLFDSTTGFLNANEQEIYRCYVIFDAMQHYPEYIIEFGKQLQKENSEESGSPAKVAKKKGRNGKVAAADSTTSADDNNNTKKDSNDPSNG